MYRFLKMFLFFLSPLFMGACSFSPTPPQQNQASVEEAREEYSEEICNHLLDKKTLDKCLKKCEEMYHKIKDRSKCQNLELDLIDDLHYTYKLLERGNKLEDIDTELFSFYISINPKAIEALKKIIKNYSSGEAEDMIFWLVDDRRAGEIFLKKDDEFNTLETLLKEFNRSYKSDELWETFTEKVNGDPLMELILSKGEKAVNWFMDFIDEKDPDCADDIKSKACFKTYCEIGEQLDDDVRQDWLGYERFENYLNKIIDEKINSQQGRNDNHNPNGWVHADAPRRGRAQIGDTNDLDEDWVEELCIGGII